MPLSARLRHGLYVLFLLLGDLLVLHLSYVFVIMALQYSLGDAFGAVVALRSYAALWPALSGILVLSLMALGFYQIHPPYFGLARLCRLVLALVPPFVFYHFALPRLTGVSAPIFLTLLHAWVCFFGLALFRLAVDRLRAWFPRLTAGRYILSKRTLIVGAGRAGRSVASLLQSDSARRGHPVVFVDDDPQKWHKKYLGIRVEGTREDIPALVQHYGIERIILALPYAPEANLQAILHYCQETPCEIVKANFGDLRTEVEHPSPLRKPEPVLNSPTKAPAVPALTEFDHALWKAEQEPQAVQASHKGPDPLHHPSIWEALSLSERLGRPRLLLETDRLRPLLHRKRVAIFGVGALGQLVAQKLLDFEPACLHLIDPATLALDEALLSLGDRGREALKHGQLHLHLTPFDTCASLQRTLGDQMDLIILTAGYYRLPMALRPTQQACVGLSTLTTMAQAYAEATGARLLIVRDIAEWEERTPTSSKAFNLYCGALYAPASPEWRRAEALVAEGYPEEAYAHLRAYHPQPYTLTCQEAACLLLNTLTARDGHYLLHLGTPFEEKDCFFPSPSHAAPPSLEVIAGFYQLPVDALQETARMGIWHLVPSCECNNTTSK